MPFLIVVVLMLFLGLSCSRFGQLNQANIPPEALEGMDVKSIEIMGFLRLSDWAHNLPAEACLTLFQGQMTHNGTIQRRAFYHDKSQKVYLGALTVQFELDEVETMLLDLGAERCILGWVATSVPGKLLNVRFERLEAEKSRWMEAMRESTVEKHVFIVPLTGEDVSRWKYITLAAVQTRQSLQRGFDGQGSYYQIEKSFSPYKDTASDYVRLPVQR